MTLPITASAGTLTNSTCTFASKETCKEIPCEIWFTMLWTASCGSAKYDLMSTGTFCVLVYTGMVMSELDGSAADDVVAEVAGVVDDSDCVEVGAGMMTSVK